MLLDTQGDPVETFSYPLSEHLRSLALALPETGEGTSCVNRAFRVRKKNFLFVGEKDGQVRIMLKLTGSLEAASAIVSENEIGQHVHEEDHGAPAFHHAQSHVNAPTIWSHASVLYSSSASSHSTKSVSASARA